MPSKRLTGRRTSGNVLYKRGTGATGKESLNNLKGKRTANILEVFN